MHLTQRFLERLEQRQALPHNVLVSLRTSAGDDAQRFATMAVKDGHIERQLMGEMLAEETAHTYVSVNNTLLQPKLVLQLGADAARRHRAIPLYRLGDVATVAMADPRNEASITAIAKRLGCPVSPVFSLEDEIEGAIRVHFETTQGIDNAVLALDLGRMANANLDARSVQALVESEQMVKLGDSVIVLALKDRASDIHIEPKKHELLVRFRVDGKLVDKLRLPGALARILVSRFKVMSGLDITERRRPQDGRFNFSLPGVTVDLRVSTLPVMYGEKVVMRILGPSVGGVSLDLDRLSLCSSVLTDFKRALRQPSGILFVCGPTGSGKTTTLHAALAFLDSRDANIVTIEDPVEYDVPTLNQVMVNESIGAGFPAVLRSVLRQDPDVILVGEIRDAETARIATQAALTGHLVLTTLHTNDAVQASTRLLDMGVEAYAVAPAIVGVMSQRLVRRICVECRGEHRMTREELAERFFIEPDAQIPVFYRGAGCDACGGTGFRGRVAIHEFLHISPRIRDAILREEGHARIHEIAASEGFQTMREDGIRKAILGLTTLGEVFAATSGDDL